MKCIILSTSGDGTFTVPADWTNTNTIIGIGGGGPGIGGSDGADYWQKIGSNSDATWPSPVSGMSVPGGFYVEAHNITSLSPGDVVNCHVATTATAVTLKTYINTGPPFADNTWLKNAASAYVMFAPGGDNFIDPPIGDGGIQGSTQAGYFAGSIAGGCAGGPVGLDVGMAVSGSNSSRNSDPDGSYTTLHGIPTAGGGAASGNLDSTDPNTNKDATRITPGTGSDNGSPGGGGDGGTISQGDGSSLLLPAVDNVPSDWVSMAAALTNIGTGDFTIEFFFSQSTSLLRFPGTIDGGCALSQWNISGNNRSWMVSVNDSGEIKLFRTLNGSTITGFNFTASGATFSVDYPHWGDTLTIKPITWYHVAIVRNGGLLGAFLNGFPLNTEADPTPFTYGYTYTDAGSWFANSGVPLVFGGTLNGSNLAAAGDDLAWPFLNNDYEPCPGWYGNTRITVGSCLYVPPGGSNTKRGQQFVPPTTTMVGGTFNTNWPGAKGNTTSTPGGMVFHGNAQIDSDMYCYANNPGTGGDGQDAPDGAAVWTDSLTSETAGPGGGGGGGGGSMGRYKVKTGGDGGNGGKYGGGAGCGGSVNVAPFYGLDIGLGVGTPGVGGIGAQGLIVILYSPISTPTARNWMARLGPVYTVT